MFEGVKGTIDITPLHDSSPVAPFRSFVLNLNCSTLFHKDQGDLEGCIVLVLLPHEGGELCFYEPRLVLEMKHGDFVVFRSQDYSHFNLHYKGFRASIVIHSDKTGVAYQQDGNGWEKNQHVR
jgi:hypothetical protein